MKNKSELLFEGYLRAHGYTDFVFEPDIAGTSRRPDYRLLWHGHEVLFEVKQFEAVADDFREGFGSFDPYPPLREKINAGRDKFRDLKRHCCCLVLYNRDKPLILLDWQHVYGAMLGNLAFEVPIHVPGVPAPVSVQTSLVFTGGGKMHRERSGVPVAAQNQTISAILVLDRVAEGSCLFHADLRDREVREQRTSTTEELWAELERARGTLRDVRRRPLRVVVHENPYARIPLATEIFRGPYDERYAVHAGRVEQVFQGDRLRRLSDME